MSSPIFQEWAARQPPRNAPPPRLGSPLYGLLAMALLLAACVCGWQEVEPLVTFRAAPAVVVSRGMAAPAKGRLGAGGPGIRRGAPLEGRDIQVSFRYEVAGQRYYGSQSSPIADGFTPAAGDPPPRGLVPGSTVTAWFNPWRPSQAVLSRAPNPTLLGWMAGLALLAAMMLLVTRAPRSSRAAADDSNDSIARVA